MPALRVSRTHYTLHVLASFSVPRPAKHWPGATTILSPRGGVLGVSFKRQVVLGGRYIVDFFGPSVGLVVEVDGGVHRGSRAADRRWEQKLSRLGYRLFHVEAAVVLSNVGVAVALIERALAG